MSAIRPAQKRSAAKTAQTAKALKRTPRKPSRAGIAAYLKQGRKAPFPAGIQKVMLATLVDKAPATPGWLYEVKWDGYRALGFLNKGKVDLKSRNNTFFNDKFYPVYRALQQWKINAVVDGEIVVVNEAGVSRFGKLQNWRSEADGELLYYLFDLLWLDGLDLTQLPLTARRAILRSIVPPEGIIRYSETFESTGEAFFSIAKKLGLEGIIAKKADSTYQFNRSKDWLKIKTHKRQEAIIAGYTKNEGTSRQFSALLLGVYENGELKSIGPVGTGFTNKMQTEILQKAKPLIIKKSPFKVPPEISKPSRFRPNPPKATVTWLKPELVCEVSFQEISDDGAMRQPSFEGLRIDKKASEVVREKEKHTPDVVQEHKTLAEKKVIIPAGARSRKTLLNPKDKTQVRDINGRQLKFGNLDKLYWPKEKISKRDMLNYYYQAAPFILPYMKDRPQSLNRYPNGITGESFYQKNVTGKVPSWMQTFPYPSQEAKGHDKSLLVCADEASLLYIAALGCIEMNPWNSRVTKPDHPDWCIIDLDPDRGNTFEQVIKAAQVTKQVLDSIQVPGYCKTSGSTGIHIYIPLGAKYTYEQAQLFGKWIAYMVHQELPDFTSIERMTKNRKGKLYIDYLQNRPLATVAAPYSLRPKPGAPVSMPLHWDEVKSGLSIRQFNIHNAIDRLKEHGDIFRPVLGRGVELKKMLGELKIN